MYKNINGPQVSSSLEKMIKSGNESKAPRRRKAVENDPLDPHSEIGSKLRTLYSDLVEEPIPLSLIELLERLDQAEKLDRA